MKRKTAQDSDNLNGKAVRVSSVKMALWKCMITCVVLEMTFLWGGEGKANGSVLVGTGRRKFGCGGLGEARCSRCVQCSYTFSAPRAEPEDWKCAASPQGAQFPLVQCPAYRPYCFIAFWEFRDHDSNVTTTPPSIFYRVARGCSDTYYEPHKTAETICRRPTVAYEKDWEARFSEGGVGVCDWGSEEHGSAMCRCNPFVAGDGCNSISLPIRTPQSKPHVTFGRRKPLAGNWKEGVPPSLSLDLDTYYAKEPLFHDLTDPLVSLPLPNNLICYHCPAMSATCADMVSVLDGPSPDPDGAPIRTPPSPCPPDDAYAMLALPTIKRMEEVSLPTPTPDGVSLERCTGINNVCQTAARMSPKGKIRAIRRCYWGDVGCTWENTVLGRELVCYCALDKCNEDVINKEFMSRASVRLPQTPPFFFVISVFVSISSASSVAASGSG